MSIYIGAPKPSDPIEPGRAPAPVPTPEIPDRSNRLIFPAADPTPFIHPGGLPPFVEEERLDEPFREYGPTTVRICEGFAFVDYPEQAMADAAMDVLRPKLAADGHLGGYPGVNLSWGKRSIVLKYQIELAEKKRRDKERETRRERKDAERRARKRDRRRDSRSRSGSRDGGRGRSRRSRDERRDGSRSASSDGSSSSESR
jgi:hypothetical protein